MTIPPRTARRIDEIGEKDFDVDSRINTTIVPTPTSWDPTERSIPPKMITKVIPSAIIPTIELFLNILTIFVTEKKSLPLTIIESNTIIPNITPTL
ncbi:hypothetical protein SDC9_208102 [bioreactor metagenome]|uniref:Uncharacterized protein n=1 Tax=bioreactor metagenome TaxID=1076179 RepID=A0A645JJ56_9ZZZZ